MRPAAGSRARSPAARSSAQARHEVVHALLEQPRQERARALLLDEAHERAADDDAVGDLPYRLALLRRRDAEAHREWQREAAAQLLHVLRQLARQLVALAGDAGARDVVDEAGGDRVDLGDALARA